MPSRLCGGFNAEQGVYITREFCVAVGRNSGCLRDGMGGEKSREFATGSAVMLLDEDLFIDMITLASWRAIVGGKDHVTDR